MKNYYLNSDVSILSSIKDYAAVTPIEAMSNGLLTISSNGNGTYFFWCGFFIFWE
jgi:hypothetical protein